MPCPHCRFSMPKARMNQILKRFRHQIYNVTIFFLFFMSLYGLLGVQFFGELNYHCVRHVWLSSEFAAMFLLCKWVPLIHLRLLMASRLLIAYPSDVFRSISLELILFLYLWYRLELAPFRSIDFKMELISLGHRYGSIKSSQNVHFIPFHLLRNGSRFVLFQQKNGTVPNT